MRLLLVGSVVAWIGLSGSPVVARDDSDPYMRYRYASCICHWGPADNAPTCGPRVSCYTQGGRCGVKCPPQTGN